jgi:hypothetical protein
MSRARRFVSGRIGTIRLTVLTIRSRCTLFTPAQELIVVALRETLLLPTDDLLAVTREFINPAVSRAGLGRCLRRHGVSDLRNLVSVLEGDKPATKKTFKDYEPGYLHIDIKYLPQMPDETTCQDPLGYIVFP